MFSNRASRRSRISGKLSFAVRLDCIESEAVAAVGGHSPLKEKEASKPVNKKPNQRFQPWIMGGHPIAACGEQRLFSRFWGFYFSFAMCTSVQGTQN